MAAAVLLDAALFRHLVSFQAGLPGRIHAYWQRHRRHPGQVADDSDQDDERDQETGALVALAVRRGDVAMLRELRALALSTPYYRAMAQLQFRGAVFLAARCGRVDVLAWLHGGETVGVDRHTGDADAADAAAHRGHAGALRWLLTHCSAECARGIDVETARRAAQRGHLDVIQCLFELRTELFTVSPAVLTSAVESGRVEIVRFLHSRPSLVRPAGYCKGLLDKAAATGQLAVVRYLHAECTAQASTEAMDVAAANGHLDVVRFLHEHRREGCTVYAMDQAAAQGHLDVVRFLHETRREGCTVYAMGGASRRGHLEVLRFLHAHRREGCSSWALAEAAEKGHLEVIAFLHEHRHGVDWEDSALFRAARNGHLEVVEYLCEHARVGDRVFDARRAAKTVGRDDIVRVLDVQIKKLLDERDLEQREKLRRRKHAKARKKRK